MDKPKKHNGRTVAQQARFMLQRMTPQAAVNAAHRYQAQADTPGTEEPTKGEQFWEAVAILLGNHVRGEATAQDIINQANKDNEMPPKQSKQKPIDVPKTEAETAAWAKEAAAEAADLERVTDLCKAFDRKLTRANNTLAKHIEDMKVNAVHAMTWADGVFKAAAEVQVFTYVIAGLTDDNGQPVAHKTRSDSTHGLQTWNTVPYLKEYAQKEVNRRAQSPGRSTSHCSNTMDAEVLSAWADVLETITWR